MAAWQQLDAHIALQLAVELLAGPVVVIELDAFPTVNGKFVHQLSTSISGSSRSWPLCVLNLRHPRQSYVREIPPPHIRGGSHDIWSCLCEKFRQVLRFTKLFELFSEGLLSCPKRPYSPHSKPFLCSRSPYFFPRSNIPSRNHVLKRTPISG